MAANNELRVRCPSCETKYKLPADAVGRKVRCAKCKTAFRVSDPRGDSHRSPSSQQTATPAPTRAGSTPRPAAPPVRTANIKRPPSEEDILRWLSEADDDAGRERRVELSVEHSVHSTPGRTIGSNIGGTVKGSSLRPAANPGSAGSASDANALSGGGGGGSSSSSMSDAGRTKPPAAGLPREGTTPLSQTPRTLDASRPQSPLTMRNR